MKRIPQIVLMLLLLGSTALGCTPQNAATIPAPPPAEFAMQVLATDLSHPWEIIFGPDGYLWVTERTGKQVTRVNASDGTKKVALTIPEVYQRTIHDGVLGMALHPELLQNKDNDFVYLVYTYDAAAGAPVDLRATVKRYTYDSTSETLGEPVDIITGVPASSDHNAGRLAFGPDQKLYYAVGDQGNNQFDNYCEPIQAQVLPTSAEIAAGDWSHYVGKVLRLNLDGSIPTDNPTFDGVQSHLFTYGHRNVQGLAISPDGQVYAAEHGPKTDDESICWPAVKITAGPRWPAIRTIKLMSTPTGRRRLIVNNWHTVTIRFRLQCRKKRKAIGQRPILHRPCIPLAQSPVITTFKKRNAPQTSTFAGRQLPLPASISTARLREACPIGHRRYWLPPSKPARSIGWR